MSNEGRIGYDLRGRVAVVTMDRPERRNALTNALYEAFSAALRQAYDDANVRAIVLRGEGGAFTAGNDIEDFLAAPPAGTDSPVFRFLKTLMASPKPVIAAVDGPAVGIGATMLLHCDLVYATARASFQTPFINLGLCPEGGSSLLLTLLVGQRKATELLLLGERFDGETALRIAYVNELCEPDALLPRALERAEVLASKAPASLRLTRALVRGPWEALLEQVMLQESEDFRERVRSDEAKEAFSAFLQKRKPDFSSFS